jgi:hypothetical protein
MSLPPSFGDLEAEELSHRLLLAGRADRAPATARARALARVTALPLAAAVLAGSRTAAGAASTSGGAWVAAKWMTVSLLVTFGGLSAVDGVQRSSETPSPLARAAQPPLPPAGAAASVPAPTRAASPAPRVTASDVPPRAQPPVPPAPSPYDARAAAQAPPDERQTPRTEPSNTAQLAREVEALELVRAALERGDGSRALAILSAYHEEFPRPVLSTEARALRIEIAFALKDPSASARAHSFLSQHGESPLAARVRTFVDHHPP